MTNIQKITRFWLKKLRSAETAKEKTRAMTALTAIERQTKLSYISRILDQAAVRNHSIAIPID